MSKYPRDRFDDVADGPRVGAHRGVARRGRGWIGFAWAALATGVLVGIGVLVLQISNNSLTLPGATSSSAAAPASTAATPTTTPSAAEPTAAPSDQASSLTITVLNGTNTTGLASTGVSTLEAAGWSIASDGNTATKGATATIVYYRTADEAAVARGIVRTLGVGTIAESAAFPNSDVTVVLGADYAR